MGSPLQGAPLACPSPRIILGKGGACAWGLYPSAAGHAQVEAQPPVILDRTFPDWQLEAMPVWFGMAPEGPLPR